jgi:hypothetical protein
VQRASGRENAANAGSLKNFLLGPIEIEHRRRYAPARRPSRIPRQLFFVFSILHWGLIGPTAVVIKIDHDVFGCNRNGYDSKLDSAISGRSIVLIATVSVFHRPLEPVARIAFEAPLVHSFAQSRENFRDQVPTRRTRFGYG